MGASGPTIGGAPIIGVASTSDKKGFHVFNNKSTYKDWMFAYDPRLNLNNALITGPYNGTLGFPGAAQASGALSSGQMQSGSGFSSGQSGNPFSSGPASAPFGQAPLNQQPTQPNPQSQANPQ